jgi:hypothetical protein
MNAVSLAGVWDIHVHASPDTRRRRHTAEELGDLAAEAGMAGFVLKNHNRTTVQLAAEVHRKHPDLQAFGGLVLNRSTGGIDRGPVARALEQGARVIWLPTADGLGDPRGGMPAVVPELDAVLRLIAAHDAVLASGHVSAAEVLPIVRAARKAGVRRIVVNHPEIPFLSYSVNLQKALRDEGVWLERCYPRPEAVNGFDQIAAEMREVGVESTILATDLGRTDLPAPLDGLRELIAEMQGRGFSDEELELATRANPRRLFE